MRRKLFNLAVFIVLLVTILGSVYAFMMEGVRKTQETQRRAERLDFQKTQTALHGHELVQKSAQRAATSATSPVTWTEQKAEPPNVYPTTSSLRYGPMQWLPFSGTRRENILIYTTTAPVIRYEDEDSP